MGLYRVFERVVGIITVLRILRFLKNKGIRGALKLVLNTVVGLGTNALNATKSLNSSGENWIRAVL